ncbi:hypothetical protein HZC00_02575 [Candidatus Kaiserbacteria bacterium]|nr:hypothetical protein [Candidatus Kaiserbacteria bacterium]
MNGTDTVFGSFGVIAQFFAHATFQWLPGSISTAFSPGEPGSLIPPIAPVSNPVGFGEMIGFLNQTSLASTQYPLYQKWISFVVFSTLVSLCLIAFIIYCSMRIKQIRANEEEKFAASAHTITSQDVSRTQMRWHRITEQIHSDGEQNWRLAILEADIMLGELLDVLGYRGETMGDKMRNVERADFNTIDMAWEAHRARNKVAHEGTSLLLNAREARRVIALYERVFREFQFIE